MNLKKNCVRISQEQPDRCDQCPLLGLIPEGQRQGKWTHVCCATGDPLTRVGIRINARERKVKDPKHPWSRGCDALWADWWHANPHHTYRIPIDRYIAWRQPYEHSLGLRINFPKK